MRRSELQDLGVEKDLIDSIMALHGKTKTRLETKIEDLEDEVNGYKKDIANRDKQLEEIKAKAPDDEKYKNLVQQYQDENEKLKEENEKIRLNSDIRVAAAGRLHNPEDALLYINRDNLKYVDGELHGLEDEIKGLEQSRPYLFVKQDVDNGDNGGASDNDGDNNPPKNEGDGITDFNPGKQSGNPGKKADPAEIGKQWYNTLYPDEK